MRDTRVEGDPGFLEEISPEFVADDLVAYDPVETAVERAGGPPAFDIEDNNGYDRQETI